MSFIPIYGAVDFTILIIMILSLQEEDIRINFVCYSTKIEINWKNNVPTYWNCNLKKS